MRMLMMSSSAPLFSVTCFNAPINGHYLDACVDDVLFGHGVGVVGVELPRYQKAFAILVARFSGLRLDVFSGKRDFSLYGLLKAS
jgi:hypothetical protein